MPPKWTIPPKDTEVILHNDLMMDCAASGQSRVWWERQHTSPQLEREEKEQSLRVLISNSHMHTLENGSLTIKAVNEDDEGVYACRASNGVGPGISQLITLTVRG